MGSNTDVSTEVREAPAWQVDVDEDIMRRQQLLAKARELMPLGEPVPAEQLIAGMVEAGATDEEWRYVLEALLTQGEAQYTENFDVIRTAA